MTFYTTKQYELNDPDGPHLPGCGNILIVIIEKMDESILVNSHEDIVRVSYFDTPINTTNTDSTGLEDFCTVNTFEPSSMPSPAPSASLFPSQEPSVAPLCVANEGTYGVTDNSPGQVDDQGDPVEPAASKLVLNFKYEVEMKGDGGAQFFESTILPSLENSIVGALLEGVFEDACSTGKNLTDWTFTNQQRRLESEIVGVNSEPADTLNEECTYLFSPYLIAKKICNTHSVVFFCHLRRLCTTCV